MASSKSAIRNVIHCHSSMDECCNVAFVSPSLKVFSKKIFLKRLLLLFFEGKKSTYGIRYTREKNK